MCYNLFIIVVNRRKHAWLYIYLVHPKMPGSFSPVFHFYGLGQNGSSLFFNCLPAFQTYRKSEQSVKESYQLFTSFLKTAASNSLPVFSKWQLVPKSANLDRIIKNHWKTCKTLINYLDWRTLNLLNEFVVQFWSRQPLCKFIIIPRVLSFTLFVILMELVC